MFVTSKVSTNPYVSTVSVAKPEYVNKFVETRTADDSDKFIKTNGVVKNISNVSVTKGACSFLGAVKDSVSYFVTNKASKDANHTDILNNKEICNITAKMSQNVYDSNATTIEGWKPVYEEDNKSNGFRAVAYQKGGNIIISYCGTNDSKDIASDAQMAMGKVPKQFEDANKFYENVCKINPDSNVIITGHSLGGSLAEFVACKNENTAAITYNAYGVEKIIDSEHGKKLNLKDNHNTFNYIIDGDPVSNSSKHVGNTTMLKVDQSKKHAVANYVDMWA